MFLFRADGNPQIGAGHIMRCLSIAGQAACPCLFVTAEEHFSAAIADRGYPVQVLHTDYSHMEEELEPFEAIIRSHAPSILFVDSYSVTFRYLQALKNLCRGLSCRLAYIDDVLAFPYPVDCLINYNICGLHRKRDYEELYLKAGKDAPRLLLGTAFAPLRAEFRNLPARKVRQQARSILISTGGADGEHLSLTFAEYIMKHCGGMGGGRFDKYQFHFIIGAMNQDLSEIQQITAKAEQIALHHNVTNMGELMRACDVAVSAAGSTLYELCATQTPTVTYILADNQVSGAEEFQRQGLLTCVGDIRADGAYQLAAAVVEKAMELAGDYQERVRIALAQRGIVDGDGGKRIIEEIENM